MGAPYLFTLLIQVVILFDNRKYWDANRKWSPFVEPTQKAITCLNSMN